MEQKPQEVMAALVARLAEQLDVNIVPAEEAEKGKRNGSASKLDH